MTGRRRRQLISAGRVVDSPSNRDLNVRELSESIEDHQEINVPILA